MAKKLVLEQIFDLLTNKETDKAHDMLHEWMVDVSKNIHKNLVKEDETWADEDSADEIEKDKDEISSEEYFGEAEGDEDPELVGYSPFGDWTEGEYYVMKFEDPKDKEAFEKGAHHGAMGSMGITNYDVIPAGTLSAFYDKEYPNGPSEEDTDEILQVLKDTVDADYTGLTDFSDDIWDLENEKDRHDDEEVTEAEGDDELSMDVDADGDEDHEEPDGDEEEGEVEVSKDDVLNLKASFDELKAEFDSLFADEDFGDETEGEGDADELSDDEGEEAGEEEGDEDLDQLFADGEEADENEAEDEVEESITESVELTPVKVPDMKVQKEIGKDAKSVPANKDAIIPQKKIAQREGGKPVKFASPDESGDYIGTEGKEDVKKSKRFDNQEESVKNAYKKVSVKK